MGRYSVDDPIIVAEIREAIIDSGLASYWVPSPPPPLASEGGVTITYTTDDPGIVPDDASIIADGDNVTDAENIEALEDMNNEMASLYTDTVSIHTALDDIVSNGGSNATLPDAMVSTGSRTREYTTNDPSITADTHVVIADGDAITNEEFHHFSVETEWQTALVHNDLADIHHAISIIINEGVGAAPVLADRTSEAGGLNITYTTDDPSISTNGAVTIADGDIFETYEMVEAMEEINAQLSYNGGIYAGLKAVYDAYLDAAGVATS